MTDRQFETRGSIDPELADVLAKCDRDPIQRMARIQPHGTFLHIEPESREILSAADNAEAFLGQSPGDLVGTPLSAIFDTDAIREITDNLCSAVDGPMHFNLTPRDAPLSANLFPIDDEVGIELERRPKQRADSDQLLVRINEVLDRLRYVDDEQALYEEAVRAVRRISGFDRVMLYKFDKENHGAVVAENKRDGARSYLDHQFPASDIPEPARRLYRINQLRYIPDAAADPVVVRGPDGPRGRRSLQMTHSTLRAAPRVHREYMANMGVAGSMSISLLVDGDLWGLIACHADEPTYLDWPRRHLCEVVGQFVARRLAEFRATRRERRYERIDQLQAEFPGAPSDIESLFDKLANQGDELRSMMGANLCYLRLGKHDRWFPEEGPVVSAEPLLSAIADKLDDQSLVEIDCIARAVDADWPHSERISGLLAVRLGASARSFAVWFRPEYRRTVEWGGDPRNPVEVDGDGQLSPRNSFDGWTQRVAEQCEPWADIDRITARRLAQMVNELALTAQSHRLRALNRRLQATNRKNQRLIEEVDEMARTDDLTGLANRGELQRQLEHAVDQARQYDNPLSFMLLDLDHFKAVNDEYGHRAGDLVLEKTATFLDTKIRGRDLAARYGGEEFAVLFPETALENAMRAARRILGSLRGHPFEYEGEEFTVTCSIGICELDGPDDTVEALVERTDRALYRAKDAGRDTIETCRSSDSTTSN